jgi:hypothetical protein
MNLLTLKPNFDNKKNSVPFAIIPSMNKGKISSEVLEGLKASQS